MVSSGTAARLNPECLTLPVREGARETGKPPVRLFLGTEAAQHRAERVFLWSIERVRDPGRVYQIWLMRGLAGFQSEGWTTGFTNYRFAIPHFGERGRAVLCWLTIVPAYGNWAITQAKSALKVSGLSFTGEAANDAIALLLNAFVVLPTLAAGALWTWGLRPGARAP